MLHIAIDGTAASGKSSIAQALAQKIGICFLDTGLMYRSVCYCALESLSPEDWDDSLALEQVAKEIVLDFPCEMALNKEEKLEVLFKGESITEKLHSVKVSSRVAIIAKIPLVREFLVAKQQEFAQSHSVIMVGRDITTVVLPHADLKVFVDADMKVRSLRRLQEISAHDKPSTDQVESSLRERDRLDSQRALAPLTCVEDALVIDNTHLTLEQAVESIERELIERALLPCKLERKC